MVIFEISFIILFTYLMIVFGCFLIFLIPSAKKAWIWTIFWAFGSYFANNPDNFNSLLLTLGIQRIIPRKLVIEFLLFFLLVLIMFILILILNSRVNRITKELMQLLLLDGTPQVLNVSLVLPSYNEADNISTLTDRLVEVSDSLLMEYEILLVDDGSTDQTGEICDQLSKKYPTVRSERLPKNQGKPIAFETGIKRSKGDIIVLIDGDLQYSPRDLSILLRPFREGFDFVNGWRVVRSDKFNRKALSVTYNYLIRNIFGTPFRDHNSGYKAFKKDVIIRIYERLNTVKLTGPHRYFLVMAEQLGFRGLEVPIKHFHRPAGSSFVNPFKTPLVAFSDLLRIRLLLSYRKTKFLEL